jgi:hypothetical protein
VNERLNEKEQNAFKAVGPRWARRAGDVHPFTLQIFNELMAAYQSRRFDR